MTILGNKNLNKYNALFICKMIEKNSCMYGFNRKAFSNRLRKQQILLPITPNNEIDWKYMEQVGFNMYHEKRKDIIDYISKRHKQLEKELKDKQVLRLEDRDWLDFNIDELFPYIQRGKRLTKADQIEGYTPYISSTSLNNGVDSFIGNKNNIRSSGNNITIANSGSVGHAFYHPYNYIASDHVHSLGNVLYNKYHYLFSITLLNRLQDKYHFNYEINDNRLKSDKLILPVTKEGELDLEFMEVYMKQIECKQLAKLLVYLK